MKRRVVALLLLAALAFPAIASANHTSNCEESGVLGDSMGEATILQGSLLGISGQFTNAAWADTCTDTNGLDQDSASSMWFGIEGKSSTQDGIVQMGVVKCDSFNSNNGSDDICDHLPDQWRYFYAYDAHTCAFNGSGPYARDLGSADLTVEHEFKITKSTDGTAIDFWLDGTLKAGIDIGHAACWWDGTVIARHGVVSCETWDRGDSCGGPSTHKVQGHAIRVLDSTRTWLWQNTVTPSACDFPPHTTYIPPKPQVYFCDVVSGTQVNLYTSH